MTDNGVDGTLRQFLPGAPGLAGDGWTAAVGVQVQSGPAFTVARASTVPLGSPLWTALFNKGTFVRSYKFDERLTQNIRSYPVRKVLTFLKAPIRRWRYRRRTSRRHAARTQFRGFAAHHHRPRSDRPGAA